MSEISEFLKMGGYARYVWSAYGIAAIVLVWNLVIPRVRARQVEKMIRKELERNRS